MLLHGLEQRALDLRRRAVDLVGEDEVGEDGALAHAEVARGLVVDERAHEVGREQVRRELDALEARVDGAGERGDGERLGEAGHALDEHVPAREQADQQALHEHGLPDDDLPDGVEEGSDERARAGDAVREGAEVGRGGGHRARRGRGKIAGAGRCASLPGLRAAAAALALA